MASAAYRSVIRTTGSSTAFTNAATTEQVANTAFQITDSAKQLLDPAVAPTVQVDSGGGYTTVAASTYTVDYLFGIITFLTALGASDTVRVSGSYLPTFALAEVREYSEELGRTMLETTVLGNSDGFKTRKGGQRDFSGDLTLLTLPEYDHDAGAGTWVTNTKWNAATPVLYERETALWKFRAWVLLEQIGVKQGPDSIVEQSVKMVSAPVTRGAAFGRQRYAISN